MSDSSKKSKDKNKLSSEQETETTESNGSSTQEAEHQGEEIIQETKTNIEIQANEKKSTTATLKFPQVKTYEKSGSIKITKKELEKYKKEADISNEDKGEEASTETLSVGMATRKTHLTTDKINMLREKSSDSITESINENDSDEEDTAYLGREETATARSIDVTSGSLERVVPNISFSYIKVTIAAVVFFGLLYSLYLRHFSDFQTPQSSIQKEKPDQVSEATSVVELQVDKDTHYKTSYWENVVYTKDFLQMEVNKKISKKWSRVVSRFFKKYAKKEVRRVGDLLILEKKLIRDLAMLSGKMNGSNQLDIEDQMFAMEEQRVLEIETLLGSKVLFSKFKKLKGKFYLVYLREGISKEDQKLLSSLPKATKKTSKKSKAENRGVREKASKKVKSKTSSRKALVKKTRPNYSMPKKKIIKRESVRWRNKSSSKKTKKSETSRTQRRPKKKRSRTKVVSAKKKSKRNSSKNVPKASKRRVKKLAQKKRASKTNSREKKLVTRKKRRATVKSKARKPAAIRRKTSRKSVKVRSKPDSRYDRVVESMELSDLESSLLGDLEEVKESAETNDEASKNTDTLPPNELNEIDELLQGN